MGLYNVAKEIVKPTVDNLKGAYNDAKAGNYGKAIDKVGSEVIPHAIAHTSPIGAGIAAAAHVMAPTPANAGEDSLTRKLSPPSKPQPVGPPLQERISNIKRKLRAFEEESSIIKAAKEVGPHIGNLGGSVAGIGFGAGSSIAGGIGLATATGAAVSKAAGEVATKTETGRKVGKWIGQKVGTYPKDEVNEEMTAGGGGIAGIGVNRPDNPNLNWGEPGRAGKFMPMLRRRKDFATSAVFEVCSKTFYNVRMGKRKGQHWRKYLDEDSALEEIREYANSNPGKPIIVQNENTGEMCYVRYGKGI